PDIDRLWRRVLGPGDPPIAVGMGPVAQDEIASRVQGYATCIVDATYFTAATLERCSGLRHIVFLGTGAGSFIDLAAAQRLGITVSTIKGYGDRAVAEHTLALILAAARNIAAMHTLLRAGHWQVMQGIELKGKTLGLIGLGGIGREMAGLARGVGLNAIAYNRSPLAAAPVPLLALEEVLARADIVSLHLALNEGTRAFLSRARLAALKRGAIL